MGPDPRVRRAFLLFLVIVITAAFVYMVRGFLMTILLAALAAGLAHPVHERLRRAFGGRDALAAAATLLLALVLVVGPIATIVGVVARQAYTVTQTAGPRVQEMMQQSQHLEDFVARLPLGERILPYRAQILTRVGEAAERLGQLLVGWLSSMTLGTLSFILQFIILLYAMFFFLIEGHDMLEGSLRLLPLTRDDKDELVGRFMSVTRATLKGTFLIGGLQGILHGLAFWVVGISGALFWAVVMTLLSVVPGVGAAIVWLPVAIYLLLVGHTAAGIGLLLFCGLVVGSVDNLLRPKLVGRDIGMGELMIFFSTIGGLALFGAFGFILGPLLAALFISIWGIVGSLFAPVEGPRAEPPAAQ